MEKLGLDAGWWEETMEETASGKPLPCRLIHAPEPTMYDQVLRHLETISRETMIPPKSQLNFGEVALAAIAVCLRWGTYKDSLSTRAKPTRCDREIGTRGSAGRVATSSL